MPSLFPAHLKVFTDGFIEGGYHLGSTGKLWEPGKIDQANRSKNKKLIGKVYEAPGPAEYWKAFETFLDERTEDQPFFFWYGTHDPHRPYDEGSGIESGKKLEDVDVVPYLPDTEAVRSDFLDYAVRIERFDHNLVKMIEILEKKGELDNTLIVVTSDNGMPFPGAKGNAYEAGVRVPMAACWGDKIKKGLLVNDLISHIDLAPTFLDAASLGGYEEIEGKSFLDLLLNRQTYHHQKFRKAVFYGRERATSARPNNFGYPVRTIRTDRYELVWNMKPERYPVGNRLDEAKESSTVTNEILKRKDSKNGGYDLYKEAFDFRPEFELHDMNKDPYALINLADDTDYRIIFDSLLSVLKDQLTENGDPRMNGRGDIWESYPRFMGIKKFDGEYPAYKGVYNDQYFQSGQRIPEFLFYTKDYQAFFEGKGISKEEYIESLKDKGVVVY